MNTEKIIRKQAKKSLSGNWAVLIAALSAICILIITAIFVINLLASAFGIIDADNGDIYDEKMLLFVAISFAVEIALLFFAPLFNGTLKMCANTAATGRTEITDMFYFFGNPGRYFRTVVLDAVLFYISNFASNFLNFYGYASDICNASLSDGFFANSAETTLILTAAFLLSLVVRVFVFLIFVYYPLAIYAVDDSMGIGRYMFGLIPFSFRHFGASLKLFLSFIGWILLCFFVVPAIYVLPYYLVSAVSSARWLFILDRSRGLI